MSLQLLVDIFFLLLLSFFIFWIIFFGIYVLRQKIHIYFLCLYTEKERIDSGFYLHQAELKKKEEKKKQKKENISAKNASAGLGAMFENDSCTNESSCPSDSNDADFCPFQKRKRG